MQPRIRAVARVLDKFANYAVCGPVNLGLVLL